LGLADQRAQIERGQGSLPLPFPPPPVGYLPPLHRTCRGRFSPAGELGSLAAMLPVCLSLANRRGGGYAWPPVCGCSALPHLHTHTTHTPTHTHTHTHPLTHKHPHPSPQAFSILGFKPAQDLVPYTDIIKRQTVRVWDFDNNVPSCERRPCFLSAPRWRRACSA
jgi:hypothetical protein